MSNTRLTKPEEINNVHIRSLGEEYREKHGKTGSLFHTNNDLAHKMYSYYEYNEPKDKWDFLADIYAKLKNNNGTMATAIRALFTDAFKMNFTNKIVLHDILPHHAGIAGAIMPIALDKSVKDVSTQMKQIITDHFNKAKNENRSALQSK